MPDDCCTDHLGIAVPRTRSKSISRGRIPPLAINQARQFLTCLFDEDSSWRLSIIMCGASLTSVSPSVTQILIIGLVIILFFGASRLKDVGKGLGEGIRNLKKGVSGGQDGESLPEPQVATSR